MLTNVQKSRGEALNEPTNGAAARGFGSMRILHATMTSRERSRRRRKGTQ